MKRTQVLLDEQTYNQVKRMAYNKGKSMSAVIRELLGKAIRPAPSKDRAIALSDFSFIGSAHEKEPDDVSVRHDDVLGEKEW